MTLEEIQIWPAMPIKIQSEVCTPKSLLFCEKVKERLLSADDYEAFLKCLLVYSTEIITQKELQSLFSDLLGKYPDLMEGFNDFLEHCERIDGFLGGAMGKKTLWSEQ